MAFILYVEMYARVRVWEKTRNNEMQAVFTGSIMDCVYLSSSNRSLYLTVDTHLWVEPALDPPCLICSHFKQSRSSFWALSLQCGVWESAARPD